MSWGPVPIVLGNIVNHGSVPQWYYSNQRGEHRRNRRAFGAARRLVLFPRWKLLKGIDDGSVHRDEMALIARQDR
jgi:hypothetical protein